MRRAEASGAARGRGPNWGNPRGLCGVGLLGPGFSLVVGLFGFTSFGLVFSFGVGFGRTGFVLTRLCMSWFTGVWACRARQVCAKSYRR